VEVVVFTLFDLWLFQAPYFAGTAGILMIRARAIEDGRHGFANARQHGDRMAQNADNAA